MSQSLEIKNWGEMDLDFVVRVFVVSQLSGSHGEWTMGDDFAPGGGGEIECSDDEFERGHEEHLLVTFITSAGNGRRFIQVQVYDQVAYFNQDQVLEYVRAMIYLGKEELVAGGVAFLNGINGEATNSDDVASTDNPQKERERVRKEAKKNQIHGKVGNTHKAKGGGAGEKVPLVVGKTINFLDQKGDVNGSRKSDKNCRDFLIGNCERKDCIFKHQLNVVVEPIAEEALPPLHYKAFGIEYVLSKKLVELAQGGRIEDDKIFETRVPEFVAFKRVFSECFVRVSPRLYQVVLSELGVLPDESRNYVSLVNFVTRFLNHSFPAIVIFDLVTYFAFRNHSKAVPTDVSPIVRHIFHSLSGGVLFRLPLCESGSKHYFYNQAWRIRRSEGFEMDADVDGSWITKPHFRTQKDIIPVTDRCKTAFYRFMPVSDFKFYGNTASNVCDAMSRLLQGRGGSLEENRGMKQRQFEILGFQSDSACELVAKCCEANYDVDNGELVTRECYWNRRERRGRGQYFVPRASSVFLDKLRRSWFNRHLFRMVWWEQLWNKMVKELDKAFWYAISVLYVPFYYTFDPVVRFVTLSEIPHPKRLLRQEWVADERTIQRMLDNTGNFESKFKWEAAKVGKPGRLYATIECNSLVGHSTMTMLKKITMVPVCLGQFDNCGDCFAMYSEAVTQEASDEMFQMVCDLKEGECRYIFFSDDGFVGYKIDGKLLIFETDISSCDASNGFPVSAVLAWMGLEMDMVQGVSELLVISSKPTLVRNPDCSAEYVLLQPETTFEYSGETLTTVKNNIASIAIAHGMYERLKVGASLEEAINLGARDFGWVLSVEQKFSMNAVTFLKRAYSVTNRTSWCVYGPILRSLGLIDGLITSERLGVPKKEFAKMTHSAMLEHNLKQRVFNLKNEPSSPILDALRTRAGECYTGGKSVSMADVCERYHADPHEVCELVDKILGLRLGDCIVGNFLEKIYHIDYGTELHEIDQRSQELVGDPDYFF